MATKTKGSVPPREWLRIEEAAVWTGLSESTIRRAKRANKLSPKKTATRGGRELYRIADLKRWIDSMEDA